MSSNFPSPSRSREEWSTCGGFVSDLIDDVVVSEDTYSDKQLGGGGGGGGGGG